MARHQPNNTGKLLSWDRVLGVIAGISLLLGQLAGLDIGAGRVYLHDGVWAALLIIGVFRMWKASTKELSAVGWSLGLFSFIAIVSLGVSVFFIPLDEVGIGGLYLVRFLTYTWGSYLFFRYTAIGPVTVRQAISIYGVMFAVLGFIQLWLYPELRNLLYAGWDEHSYRLVSTVLDPNFAAGILLIGFFVSLSIWQTANKWWGLGAVMFHFLALFLTYSRSGYLALLCGASVYLMYSLKKWLIVPFFLVFLALIVVLPRPGGETLRLLRTASSTSRLENWRYSIALWQESPIIGIGFNTLKYANSQHRGTDTMPIRSRDAGGLDNSLLLVLVTTGAVGLFIFLKLLFAMRNSLLSAQSTRGVYAGLYVALLVQSFFVNSLFYPWIILLVWVLVASEDRLSTKR